jgi:glyoxylase-like metal-dependent hydrolase (beta-lactamase superfamily II)
MKKPLLLLSIILSFKAMAQPNIENASISTIKIKNHIHLLQWTGAGNMMLLSGKDGNILIDDQFAPLSEKINAAVQTINKGPVKFLFNTHYHGDHSGGNENFAKMGATIFAHENVRARMSVDTTKIRFRQKPKPTPQAAWPVVTYKEGMTLHLNGEDVILFHVDNAHTDGDVLFYLVQSNVLHTGDCFMKDRFPFIDTNSGGSVDGWLNAAARALTLIDDETVIIPGHGDLATKKDYRAARDAVMTLRDTVRKEVKANTPLDGIIAKNLTKEYDTTFGSGFIKGDALIRTIYIEQVNKP